MIEHRLIEAGLRFHIAEAGPRDGELVILLHGFPDCWSAWEKQLVALGEAGYHAVAPDLRGYGGTDKPRRVRDYSLPLLAGDVKALIEALGARKAHVAGHDWGAAVAWSFAMWHPETLGKLVIANVPHPRELLRGLRRPAQLRRSWYMFFFQLPVLPERMVRRTLRKLYRFVPETPYAPEEIDRIVEAVGDAHGPINYYRAALRGPRKRWERIDAPTLVIWGERDRFLGRELAAPDPRWVPNARVERLPQAGHWAMHDEPAQVNELLLRFLRAP